MAWGSVKYPVCLGSHSIAEDSWRPLLLRHPQILQKLPFHKFNPNSVSTSESPTTITEKNRKISCLYILLLSLPPNMAWNVFILLLPSPGVVVVGDVFNLPCAVLLEQHWGNLLWNQNQSLALMLNDPSMTSYIIIPENIFDSFSFFSSSSVVFLCFSHILSAFLIHTISVAEIPVIARTEPQLELCPKGCLL